MPTATLSPRKLLLPLAFVLLMIWVALTLLLVAIGGIERQQDTDDKTQSQQHSHTSRIQLARDFTGFGALGVSAAWLLVRIINPGASHRTARPRSSPSRSRRA